MKAKELKERESADLVQLKEQTQKELFSFKMKNYLGQLDDTSLIPKKRRDVARIEGILAARKAEKKAAPAAGSKS
ncbi:MAG TPA: 50S ribosomal protein L29 [Polyangiaceae bacterium]|jgi:ribosomal protein L29|nr:50S ribosomal protein L29 [Polyangiaceae bacterium]